ncbi:MAG: ABC transporter substrate-binding protein [Chloroflexota bacterium]|nr:MAG: ABC transporter substrate-binding protein [Chloroflexota bacterium]
MNRRDRAVVGVLLVVLAVLVTGLVAGGFPPARPTPSPSPSPAPSPAAAVPYREGVLGQPDSVTPLTARNRAARDLVALAFSGLVRPGPGDGWVPDLAERWTSDADGRTWTFILRPGLTWQDGQPLTAADVAFTVHLLQDPAYDGPAAGSWSDVSVSTPDERTVVFELATPVAGFLGLAAQPIVPRHLLEGVPADRLAGAPFVLQPVGSGPFRIVGWSADRALLEAAQYGSQGSGSVSPSPDRLVAAGGRPLPDLAAIEMAYFRDEADLVAAYRRGELDAAVGLSPAVARELGDEAGSRLLRYPTTTLSTVVLNLRASHKELRDARVRRALLAAIDRGALIDRVVAGLAVPADGPIPPTASVFDPAENPTVPHAPSVAVDGLRSAGWTTVEGAWRAPGGEAAYEIELICPTAAANPTAAASAAAVAADWRELGISVRVVELDPATYSAQLRSGDFDAALVDVAIGDDPDLYPLLASSQTVGGGSNVSGLQDPQLDKLLTAARTPADEATRRAAFATLQRYLAEHTFLLPLYWRQEPVVLSDRVVGPTVRPLGDLSDRFWDVLTWRLADDR